MRVRVVSEKCKEMNVCDIGSVVHRKPMVDDEYLPRLARLYLSRRAASCYVRDIQPEERKENTIPKASS